MKQDLYLMRDNEMNKALKNKHALKFNDDYEKVTDLCQMADMRQVVKSQALRDKDLDMF
jgi:hypothetical protein